MLGRTRLSKSSSKKKVQPKNKAPDDIEEKSSRYRNIDQAGPKGRSRTLSVPDKPLKERYSIVNRGRLQSTFNADPDMLIIDWTFQFDVPEWVEPEARAKCCSCDSQSSKLSSHDCHNCRLCGELFCSLCTGKYYVPDEFHLKNKRGAVRVCWGCRAKCLKLRSETRGNLENPSHRPRMIIHSRNKISAPEEWSHPSQYSQCFCCQEDSLSHRYHCRICGELLCKTCTVKIYLPFSFRRKGKIGASRVCLECRYMMHNGYELDPGDVGEDEEEDYYEEPESPRAGTRLSDLENAQEPSSPIEIVDDLLYQFQDSSNRSKAFSM